MRTDVIIGGLRLIRVLAGTERPEHPGQHDCEGEVFPIAFDLSQTACIRHEAMTLSFQD
jgi:hypothetical protein